MQEGSLTWLLAGASAPHHVGISTRLPECFQTRHLASPSAIDVRERERDRQTDRQTALVFDDLVSKVLPCHFCIIVLTRGELLDLVQSQGEENYFPPLKWRIINEFLNIFFM